MAAMMFPPYRPGFAGVRKIRNPRRVYRAAAAKKAALRLWRRTSHFPNRPITGHTPPKCPAYAAISGLIAKTLDQFTTPGFVCQGGFSKKLCKLVQVSMMGDTLSEHAYAGDSPSFLQEVQVSLQRLIRALESQAYLGDGIGFSV
ncbi:MAG: hypothetical protein LBR72_03920, partial [Oscillospiraceae bacterium]|nr:hypothetical protein [Oscillospiraceae bacterium]